MHDASHPRRRNTAEEIRQLGATQSRARTRGFVALAAGVLSAVGLLGAFVLLSRPTRTASPLARAAEVPAAELREASPDAPTATGPRPRPERTPNPGPRRPRDPIAALARPAEAERPLSAQAPSVHAGPVDLEELARSMASQKKGAVQLCFERELKRDPHLKGSVLVRLTLEAPHKVGAVSVRDDLKLHSFTKCVRSAMRSVDFPNLPEDVTVELPFALKSPELI